MGSIIVRLKDDGLVSCTRCRDETMFAYVSFDGSTDGSCYRAEKKKNDRRLHVATLTVLCSSVKSIETGEM